MEAKASVRWVSLSPAMVSTEKFLSSPPSSLLPSLIVSGVELEGDGDEESDDGDHADQVEQQEGSIASGCLHRLGQSSGQPATQPGQSSVVTPSRVGLEQIRCGAVLVLPLNIDPLVSPPRLTFTREMLTERTDFVFFDVHLLGRVGENDVAIRLSGVD